MKKSGTYWSWTAFGVIAECIFLLTMSQFGLPLTLNWYIVMSTIFIVMTFVLYRFAIDWQINDNVVEDELRQLVVSDHYSMRLTFAALGGFILLIAHPETIKMNLYLVWSIAMSSIVLSSLIFETLRTVVNEARRHVLQQRLLHTTNTTANGVKTNA